MNLEKHDLQKMSITSWWLTPDVPTQVGGLQRLGGSEERQPELGSGCTELPPGLQRDRLLDQREDQGAHRRSIISFFFCFCA